MSTGFRGPLLYSNLDVPFNGIPLNIAQCLNRTVSGIAVGGGTPYLGPAAAATENGWVLTDSAGAGTITLDTTGRLVITTHTGDEAYHGLQYTQRPFIYSTTRNISCFARLKLSDVDKTDAAFGLIASDTSILGAGAEAAAESIMFYKEAVATDWTATVQTGDTATTAVTGLTLADDTYSVIGFTVIAGAIRWFAKSDSGNQVTTSPGFLGTGTAIANTNVPTGNVVFSFAVGQEGGTTARVMTVDWSFCCQWD